MLEPNRNDTPETKEELIPVTFKVRLEDLSAIYSKYSQNSQKLRNDIDRLVRELKAAKWDLKQTTAKLEKSEQLTRQLQVDNKTYKDRLAQAVIGRVVYQSPPEKVREYHLKDATITRLQAEITDYQQQLASNQQVKLLQRQVTDLERIYDDTNKSYRASLEDKDRLSTQVTQLQSMVNRLRAERDSLYPPLEKLLEIWGEYNDSDE